MTDLDIQIDVPDDDDHAQSSVRVLNGGWLPPWFKAAALVILAGLAALVIGAYLVGRSGSAGDLSPPAAPTPTPAPISSAEASPAVNASLEAVQAWEQFARSGDLAPLARHFDPTGPQYLLFEQRATNGTPADPPDGAAPVDFSARNLAETVTTDLTTVSMDLAVTGPRGQEIFPYDLVFRRGSALVWTVVDRRSPGSVALPPEDGVVAAALDRWERFTEAVAVDDAAAAAEAASARSRQLVDQVAAALASDGDDPAEPGPPLDDPELFAQLVERARATAGSEEVTLLSLLDSAQRRAIVAGRLGSWTQVADDRIVATLVVEGQPVTIVPFAAENDDWAFDLVEAIGASRAAAD